MQISRLSRRIGPPVLVLAMSVVGFAQTTDTLTLDQALKMARQRNGDIMAAQFDVVSADARVKQAMAAFFPTITPSYIYNSQRQQVLTTGGSTFIQDEGASTQVNATWQLLDLGERSLNVRANQRSLMAQRLTARQTVRGTLFTVTQDFYEALRSQELLRVAKSQVDRAKAILDQVQARIGVQDAAKIDKLQANADYQNAVVEALVAQNKVTTNDALLKSVIGLNASAPMPVLQKEPNLEVVAPAQTLPQALEEGIANRPDLLATRQSVDALQLGYELAKRQASLSASVNLTFNQEFTPDSLQDRALVLSLSYPLFDGDLRRQEAREAGSNLAAQRALLVQTERDVRAEIESSHYEFTQDSERLSAAQVALDAAQQNYKAAQDSYGLGAYDLIQVITAETSLTTAESNYIQAVYDYRISESQLRLVTGMPMQGE